MTSVVLPAPLYRSTAFHGGKYAFTPDDCPRLFPYPGPLGSGPGPDHCDLLGLLRRRRRHPHEADRGRFQQIAKRHRGQPHHPDLGQPLLHQGSHLRRLGPDARRDDLPPLGGARPASRKTICAPSRPPNWRWRASRSAISSRTWSRPWKPTPRQPAKPGIYAVPLDTHTFVVYYNKDLLKKAGVLDANGMMPAMKNIADMTKALQTIKDKTGVTPMALSTNQDSATPWRLWYSPVPAAGRHHVQRRQALPRRPRHQGQGGAADHGRLDQGGAAYQEHRLSGGRGPLYRRAHRHDVQRQLGSPDDGGRQGQRQHQVRLRHHELPGALRQQQ